MKKFPWQILLDWYEKYGKHDFPWRQYHLQKEDGYHVWLAEILLQQTQADRVVGFYKKILEKYPTIHDLARSSYEEFFPYYQGLGYYSRARNLLKTATIISEEYRGIFPRDKSKLIKLPGVGEYTARAILAFGYGESVLAWDTNLETVFSRYYKGSKAIKLTPDEKEEIEKDFREFIISISIGGKVVKGGDLGREIVGVGGKKDLGGAKLPYPKGISNATESQMGSFSHPNSFGTFSTKSTGEIMSEKKNVIREINNALMDWARTMEPKTSSLLNKESYIFTESQFYISSGETEIIEKKKTEYFPIPDATIMVTLHQDHKIYYSLSGDQYSPFMLPPSLDRDTRKYVQNYFREKYQLELSVRPVHKKWLSEDGKPYVAVNAQIQTGGHNFSEWKKSDIK